MKAKVDLVVAQTVADKYIDLLKPHCEPGKVRVAGSVRRKCPRVGDIEIVCIPKIEVVPDGMFHEQPVRVPGFAAVVLDAATEITKGDPAKGKYTQFMVEEGIQIDLFMADKMNWGRLYLIRTGSSEFTQFIAKRWAKWGYKGIEGQLWEVDDQRNPIRCISTPTEKSVFDLLGLPVVPPTKRNQGSLPS